MNAVPAVIICVEGGIEKFENGSCEIFKEYDKQCVVKYTAVYTQYQ